MSLFSKLLFPPKCAACGVLLDWYSVKETDSLCPACLAEWEAVKSVICSICGERVTQCSCVTDEMRKANCSAFHKLAYYHGGRRDRVQNRLVFHIKESRDIRTIRFLTNELKDTVSKLVSASPCETVVTYMPRGRAARLKYGTDQGEQLARSLARVCKTPCRRLIKRTRKRDPAQKELSATARKRNAKEAFALVRNANARGKQVILVDDIVTTGNTASACARLLHRAGAQSVICVAVASDDVNREIS